MRGGFQPILPASDSDVTSPTSWSGPTSLTLSRADVLYALYNNYDLPVLRVEDMDDSSKASGLLMILPHPKMDAILSTFLIMVAHRVIREGSTWKSAAKVVGDDNGSSICIGQL